mgnify:CR=1 FL=1
MIHDGNLENSTSQMGIRDEFLKRKIQENINNDYSKMSFVLNITLLEKAEYSLHIFEDDQHYELISIRKR